MAACQVPSMINLQPAQCGMDIALHLSQASELKHQTLAGYLLWSKASSCLSSTMVKPNEHEDTATSELTASTASRPSEAQELKLSISGVYAAEITAPAGSGVDVQGENLQVSLERITDVEEGFITSSESAEQSLVGPPTKRIRSNALGFNPNGNEIALKIESLHMKCLSSTVGHGAMLAGTKKSDLSSDRELYLTQPKRPGDWTQGMSWQSSGNYCTSQQLLSQQTTHGTVCKVTPLDCHVFSGSQCNDGFNTGKDTVMPVGVIGFESPFVGERPSYSLKAATATNESMDFCTNTGTHGRDEMSPISTGMMYGELSEQVTLCSTKMFGQHHLPTELGQINFAQWHPPLVEIQQHVPRVDSPATAFHELGNSYLHNRLIGACSFEGKQALCFNPSTGFGLPLAPIFSTFQPNAGTTQSPFAMCASSEMLLQSLTSTPYSEMNVPFPPSVKAHDNLMDHSGPRATYIDIFQSLHKRPSSDLGIQSRQGQHATISNAFPSEKNCSSLISDLNLSLLANSQTPLSNTSATLHSFPWSLGKFAYTDSQPVATGGMELKLSGLSLIPPDFGILDSNTPELLPSITVVMEDRSIGGMVCLQKLDGYESLAHSMRDMFKNNIPEESLAALGSDCNLSTAIPGFVIAYEDAENDLLLAGDLSWRDFVRVAKRIRVIPAKISKTKDNS